MSSIRTRAGNLKHKVETALKLLTAEPTFYNNAKFLRAGEILASVVGTELPPCPTPPIDLLPEVLEPTIAGFLKCSDLAQFGLANRKFNKATTSRTFIEKLALERVSVGALAEDAGHEVEEQQHTIPCIRSDLEGRSINRLAQVKLYFPHSICKYLICQY